MPVVENRPLANVSDLQRRLDPALPLIRIEVRRAGQDRPDARSIVQLAENQPVGVGMRVDFLNFGDDEFIRGPGQPGKFKAVPSLDRKSVVRERV